MFFLMLGANEIRSVDKPEYEERKMTQQEIVNIAMQQSAVDCSCSEDDFRRTENVIVESGFSENASRYMTLPHICALFSYGSNIVASCRRDLIPEIASYVNEMQTTYRCFDTPGLYELNQILQKADAKVAWMHICFLPDWEEIRDVDYSCPFETRILYPKDFTDLYVPEWRNALCSERKELDKLGVGAYDGDKLIGLAGCSADCPEMWQIGIDVLPEYRRKGIASALTGRLAQAVFEQGKVPFYASAWSNIRSIRNGLRSGFRPAWVALTAKAD